MLKNSGERHHSEEFSESGKSIAMYEICDVHRCDLQPAM